MYKILLTSILGVQFIISLAWFMRSYDAQHGVKYGIWNTLIIIAYVLLWGL